MKAHLIACYLNKLTSEDSVNITDLQSNPVRVAEDALNEIEITVYKDGAHKNNKKCTTFFLIMLCWESKESVRRKGREGELRKLTFYNKSTVFSLLQMTAH